jgi:hypothetical protein
MAHYGQGAVQINPLPYPYGPAGYVLAVNSLGQLYWVAVSGVGGIISSPPAGGLACTNIYYDTVSGQWVFVHA